MKRIQCPKCKEFPRWNSHIEGKQCGVCGYVRPVSRRTSQKKARFEATLQEVLKDG